MVPWMGASISGTSPVLIVRTKAKQRTVASGYASWRCGTIPIHDDPRVITSSTKVICAGAGRGLEERTTIDT